MRTSYKEKFEMATLVISDLRTKILKERNASDLETGSLKGKIERLEFELAKLNYRNGLLRDIVNKAMDLSK